MAKWKNQGGPEVFRGTGAGMKVEWAIFGVKKAIRDIEALGDSIGELMKPEVTEIAERVLKKIKEATPIGKSKHPGKLKNGNKLYATRVSKNFVTAQIRNKVIYAPVVEWGRDGKGRKSFMRATVKRLQWDIENRLRRGAIQKIEKRAKQLGVK